MPIKLFEFTSIEGKRFSKSNEKIINLKIDHNSTVTLVSPFSNSELSVDFRFNTSFSGFGIITIEGHLLWGDGDAQKIAKAWSTTSQIPNEIAQELHVAILTNCISEVVILSRDLHLPPPIPIPSVNLKDNKITKPSGIEVA